MLKPEILAIATDLAIQLYEAKHPALADVMVARWVYDAQGLSRTIEVQVDDQRSNEGTEVFRFDGPKLVADYDGGVNLFARHIGNNVVPIRG